MPFILTLWREDQKAGELGPYAQRRSAVIDAKTLLMRAGVAPSDVKVIGAGGKKGAWKTARTLAGDKPDGTRISATIKAGGSLSLATPKKAAKKAAPKKAAPKKAAPKKAAKLPTYKAARQAAWSYFGKKGWTLSSPGLKVLHATSPDKKLRLWFKSQSVLREYGPGPWKVGNAHAVVYGLDLRKITPAQFYNYIIDKYGK